MRWKVVPSNPDFVQTLTHTFSFHPLISQLLANRGIKSIEEAEFFLNPSLKNLPSPFLIHDMEKGVCRILRAIQNNEKISIFSDYDVDGITSAALGVHYFREIGIEIETTIPDRIKEGYGLNPKAMENLKNSGVSLVITADCGSKSHDSIRRANEIGLDVIVTDHHQLDKEPPPAYAFINPQTGNVGKELAGVGVFFFLLLALRQKMRDENLFPNGEPNLKKHLDLVAFGTLADMVPLNGINRTLVTFGLKELATTTKPGLIALKESAKLGEAENIQTSDIGFRLAPRINAGGRIGQSRLGLNLLIEENIDRARKWAVLLDQCNTERKGIQEQHLREAKQQMMGIENRLGLVVSSADWNPGIVGLVASKLVEEHYRPAIALCIRNGIAKGSARSISGVDIVAILERCSGLLEQFGGHAMAAGLTLPTKNLESFTSSFETLLRENFSEETFEKSVEIDGEITLDQINAQLLKDVERLRPFGPANRTPVFATGSLTFSHFSVVGEDHLKMKVAEGPHTFDAIGFQLANRIPKKPERGRIAFTPEWNDYMGRKTIQLKIKDIV